MSKRVDLKASAWSDYELLDSGENMKLERFGDVVIARPETQALWKKARPEIWENASAIFSWNGNKGAWKIAKNTPDEWQLKWKDMRLHARLTSFKHTGIFPEQSTNWEWLQDKVTNVARTTSVAPKVLNLFGYTGAASIVSALSGAQVTHVDASKQSLSWAHKNANASGVSKLGDAVGVAQLRNSDTQKSESGSIRYILDDALSFSKREVRRTSRYNGIILDPPAFGRGAKGEVWHIEKDLPILIELLHELLIDAPDSFLLLNGYASGYAPVSFLQLLESTFKNMNPEYGELAISEANSSRVIPAGMYVRFAKGTEAS